MIEVGFFPHGIRLADGTVGRSFTLRERTFRHTLEIQNDPEINRTLLDDGAYVEAALIAKRLRVEGIEKLTPEMIQDLDAEDGDALFHALILLEKRRAEFREKESAVPAETGGAPEDRGGLPEHP